MLNNLTRVNESLIKEQKDNDKNFTIYKYDIDSDKEFVINELGIRSVPTIKIFKEGKEIFSKAGVLSPNEVLSLLN